MRAPLAVSLIVVAGALAAGAYGLGFFDGAVPPAPADSAVPAAESPADATPPAPAEPSRPAPSRERAATPDVPEIRTPLPPPPTTATLTIRSDVPGADVFIDNSFVGKAPATVEGVQPGRRKISVSAPGYETVAEFHEIEVGSDEVSVPLEVIRLDRRVAVTHRHRLGSCEGTLVATPQGVRYETTHTDDAFDAAFDDIASLKADYLKRRLEIDVTGGRNYDFSVPEARADELYSFYQDVEKARQRLEEGGGDV